MHLSIRMFGLELLTIEASTDEQQQQGDAAVHLSGGTTSAYPIGFAPDAGDQAWEQGVER